MRNNASWLKKIIRTAAALLLLGLTAHADANEPFGLTTVPAPEGPLWMTWRKLQGEMKSERALIARCRAALMDCPSIPARRFIAIADQGKDFAGIARIGHINRAVNLAIRAVKSATPAARHNWTSPLAALAAGAGDCKQYAVLKYAALQDAGFTADNVRIVIVAWRKRPEAHAMVAVRNAGKWLILDNRTLAIVESSKLLDRFAPLKMFDRRGVRQFVRAPRVAAKFGAACAG
jgi:predicted transglutaminase-like cysteine proteinase